MRVARIAFLLLALSGALLGQTTRMGQAEVEDPVLFQIMTRAMTPAGIEIRQIIVRVHKSGLVEYTRGVPPQLQTGHLGAPVLAKLTALLNSPSTRRVQPSYPAWNKTASPTTFRVAWVSGTMGFSFETADVFPIPAGKHLETPDTPLRLVCAGVDLRAAVDAQFAREGAPQARECTFPHLAKPAR